MAEDPIEVLQSIQPTNDALNWCQDTTNVHLFSPIKSCTTNHIYAKHIVSIEKKPFISKKSFGLHFKAFRLILFAVRYEIIRNSQQLFHRLCMKCKKKSLPFVSFFQKKWQKVLLDTKIYIYISKKMKRAKEKNRPPLQFRKGNKSIWGKQDKTFFLFFSNIFSMSFQFRWRNVWTQVFIFPSNSWADSFDFSSQEWKCLSLHVWHSEIGSQIQYFSAKSYIIQIYWACLLKWWVQVKIFLPGSGQFFVARVGTAFFGLSLGSENFP